MSFVLLEQLCNRRISAHWTHRESPLTHAHVALGAIRKRGRMSSLIRFIGDVHGKYDAYKRAIAAVPRSIQVGDMGVGFRHARGARLGEPAANPPHYAMVRGDHRFIRGNHDNPTACRTQSQWIPDGHCEDAMMFVGGAVSIDKDQRTEGYDWWPDEELSEAELQNIGSNYLARKPRIMVTHDCPEEVAAILLAKFAILGTAKRDLFSRTRVALQEMWAAHPPELWIFGHYHVSFEQVLHHGDSEAGTRFICLAELECRDIDAGGPPAAISRRTP